MASAAPSGVAAPMLTTPELISERFFKWRRSAPTSGPRTPATEATGGDGRRLIWREKQRRTCGDKRRKQSRNDDADSGRRPRDQVADDDGDDGRAGRRPKGVGGDDSEAEEFVERQSRGDEASADIDGDDGFAPDAPDFRPKSENAENRKGVRRNLVLARQPGDRNIDKAAEENRHNDRRRDLRFKMELGEFGDHHLAQDKGKQNKQKDRDRYGEPDDNAQALIPSFPRRATLLRSGSSSELSFGPGRPIE